MSYIKKLPNWNLTNSDPGIYDLDSKTAVEMTAKLYKAMQESIDVNNAFLTNIEEIVADYQGATSKDIAAFKIAIEQKFQDFTEALNTKYNYLEVMVQDIELLIKDLNEGRGD